MDPESNSWLSTVLSLLEGERISNRLIATHIQWPLNLRMFWKTNLREMSDDNFRLLIQIRITDTLLKIHWELTETFRKFVTFFVVMFLDWFLQKWVIDDISSVFRKYSDNVPKIFRQPYGGYTIKLLLTNCLFHTGNIRTLLFLYVKSAVEYFAFWT